MPVGARVPAGVVDVGERYVCPRVATGVWSVPAFSDFVSGAVPGSVVADGVQGDPVFVTSFVGGTGCVVASGCGAWRDFVSGLVGLEISIRRRQKVCVLIGLLLNH